MTLPFDPAAISRLCPLGLAARELVEGFLTGVHRSPYKGASVEFAEHRAYAPGDEIRHIDWRAVAKTDRLYVKEFEEETNLRAHLLVDASGSMAYAGKAGVSKFRVAQLAAASLAYLMLHQRDAVGLTLHDERVRAEVPPHATSKHLMRILQLLDATTPGGETALGPLWDLAAQRLKGRGLVMILSDCFADVPGMLRALQRLRHRRHEVVLFRVLAAEEVTFDFDRPTQFRSLETAGRHILVDPRAAKREYLANFERHRQELREACGRTGVDLVEVRTDEDVSRVLGVYLARR